MSALRRYALIGSGVAVVIVLVLVVASLLTVRRALPSYGGELDLEGLTGQVRVVRDAQGVPQIYADTPQDLFFAQGYVQAQDRFLQMDVRRHVTAGRLSELVGSNEAALSSDTLVRTLGWRRVAEAELPLLSGTTRNYLQAYSDGVNAYIADRSPSELDVGYAVLGSQVDLRQIEPWTPVDSLSWLKAMAWDLKGNYNAELGRALSYTTLADVGMVNLLYPGYPAEHPTILAADPSPMPLTQGASLAMVLAATGTSSDHAAIEGTGAAASAPEPAVPDSTTSQPAGDGAVPAQSNLTVLSQSGAQFASLQRALDSIGGPGGSIGIGDGLGSNAIVVGGQHTASGLPIIADDPHLAATTPSTWYQSGLHCTKVDAECPFDVSGASFAGLPGVMIGHNGSIGWGMSNLAPDTTDFFLERVIGDTYVQGQETTPLTTRTETIRVAGEEDHQITVRSTVHGPIISDVLTRVKQAGSVQPGPDGAPMLGDYAVSLGWTGNEPGRTMDAVFGLNAAGNWDEFRAALSFMDAPGLSFVYADTAGHIGYQATGKVPTRQPGPGLGQADGTWPRQGWDAAWDWTGYVPFESMPAQLDPASGFIVAANQKVSPSSSLTVDWDYGDRAARITSLLSGQIEAGEALTVADLNAIQMDDYSAFAADVLVPLLRAAPPSDSLDNDSQRAFVAEAVELLDDWDATMDSESPAAAYYNAVWSNLVRETFSDQLPDRVAPDGGPRTYAIMRTMLQEQNNAFWDDVTTPTIIENRDQAISQALANGRFELTSKLGKDPATWSWGNLHILEPQQRPLGSDGAPWLLKWVLNDERLRVSGSSATVNVSSWNAASGNYRVNTIASMRMVIDLSDFDSSTWVDFTGVSGHLTARHHGDQTDHWLTGGTYPWPYTAAAVDEVTQDEMTLSPAPSSSDS
ncbi:MAG: penicillin acylase family protein [Actinomycetales bacterium]